MFVLKFAGYKLRLRAALQGPQVRRSSANRMGVNAISGQPSTLKPARPFDPRFIQHFERLIFHTPLPVLSLMSRRRSCMDASLTVNSFVSYGPMIRWIRILLRFWCSILVTHPCQRSLRSIVSRRQPAGVVKSRVTRININFHPTLSERHGLHYSRRCYSTSSTSCKP